MFDRSLVLVTGAGGQLGRLVVEQLLLSIPADAIAVMVRGAEAGAPFAARGLHVRIADYDHEETLDAALVGVDRVLLISSNAIGRRVAQHRNVIEAARRAAVGLVAYTSVLHADASPLGLAGEHRETEALLRASGLPYVILRNGWYAENHLAAVPTALQHGAFLGSAGTGRIASAARADYAAAAVAVLTADAGMAGRILELAGDDAFTLAELAAEVSRQAGRNIAYVDMTREDYEAALLGAGLPGTLAALLADSDACAAHGALYDDGRELGRLIGRPTTTLAASVAQALAAVIPPTRSQVMGVDKASGLLPIS